MSNSEEEFLGEDPEARIMLDTDSNYTSRFVGEGRFIEDVTGDSSRHNLLKQVGKVFNFGALSSKRKGSASITKRGASARKAPTKKSLNSG